MSAANCAIHPELPAANTCSVCKKLICDACTSPAGMGSACPGCVSAMADRKKRARMIAVGIGAFAVLGLVGFLVVTSGGDEAEAEPRSPLLTDGFDYGAATEAVGKMAMVLEAEPCNKSIALDLAEELNRHGDHGGALKVVAAYDESCEPYRKLWWKQMYAHEQLGQWKESLAVGNKLVTAKPDQSSYWWWRARAHVRVERTGAAIIDVRQSLARRIDRKTARMLHELAPCEGAFALVRYLDRKPDSPWAEDLAKQALEKPECDRLRGTGTFELTWPEDGDQPPLEAGIGDETLRATLMPRHGTTVISKAAADRLGLSPAGPETTALVGDEVVAVRPTVLAKVSFGDAAVTDVPAVIAPTTGSDADLAVGQSLLWRFEVSITPGAIKFYELPGVN